MPRACGDTWNAVFTGFRGREPQISITNPGNQIDVLVDIEAYQGGGCSKISDGL
jgi:hypothetical protein